MPKGSLINFLHGDLNDVYTSTSLGPGYSFSTGNVGTMATCEPWVNTNAAAKQLWVDNVCINPHLQLATGNTQTYLSLAISQDPTTGEVIQTLTFDPSGLSSGNVTIPDHWILNVAQYDSTGTYANEWEYYPTTTASEHSPIYRIIVGDANAELTFNYSTGVLNHATHSATSTTSSANPAHGGTFTVIDSVTVNSYGHVTGYNTKTVTLPSDNNTTYTLDADAQDTLTMDGSIVSSKYKHGIIQLNDGTSNFTPIKIRHKAQTNNIGSVMSFIVTTDNGSEVIETEILKIDGGTF